MGGKQVVSCAAGYASNAAHRDGNFGRNQLLDGSISFLPLRGEDLVIL